MTTLPEYHNTMHTKIPESGFSLLLYYLYSIGKQSIKLDLDKLLSNCNQYLIDRVDKSTTSGKISCVPIQILRKLRPNIIQEKSMSDVEYKRKLLESVMNETDINLLEKYSVYYKPIFTKPAVTTEGWDNNSIFNNPIETVPMKQGESNSNKELWLSNINLAALMKSYVILSPNTMFLGVMYLSCFDTFNETDMKNVYPRTALNSEIDKILHQSQDKQSGDNNTKFLAFIVSRAHWSSIIIDTESKRCYHFCSGGNNITHYKPSKKMIFYSTSRSFVRGCGRANHKMVAPKNSIFEHLMKEGYTVYMNVESCQILSGECGMFASLFLIFFCIGNISNITDIKAMYNSFSFLGDKTVGMFKELLFWRERTQSPNTVCISPDRLKIWKRTIDEQFEINNLLTANILLDQVAINKIIQASSKQ